MADEKRTDEPIVAPEHPAAAPGAEPEYAGRTPGAPDQAATAPTASPQVKQDYDSPISGFGEQPAKGGKIHYGGQAVIEGVMMRGPEKVAVAVRMPSREIAIHVQDFIPATRRHRLLRLPVLRGGATLIESLMLGIRALNYSASVAMEEVEDGSENGGAEESSAAEPRPVPPPSQESDWKTKAALTGTMVFAFALGIVFFFWIPLVLTDFVMNTTGAEGGILFNLIDGVIRVIFFLAYIWGISLWGEMRRVFEYHGAEHKTIFMQEAGEDLTPENAHKYATKHPRCGTSFLLIVMVVSILVFMIFGRPENIGQRLLRIALIPVIAGVSYEFMKLTAKFSARRWARMLSGPGIWLQNITTKEPTDDQVEVAIASLKAVRVEEAPMGVRPANDSVVADAAVAAGDGVAT
jgi:uncharacterized protein YqhQ